MSEIPSALSELHPVQGQESLHLRITDYLASGGLFNPEMMEHDKVRDLLLDIRDFFIENPTK